MLNLFNSKLTKCVFCLTATTQVYFESTEYEELHEASCTGIMAVPLELAKCSQCDKAYSRKQVRLSKSHLYSRNPPRPQPLMADAD